VNKIYLNQLQKPMRKIIYTFALLFFVVNAVAQTSLVPIGSTWKYLDNGSNQGTAWRATSFNDGSWASGPAQLGYGDGDEATVVSYGSQSSNKYITTYFRKTISVSDASLFSGFTLKVRRDDGIVVYINGVEKYRNNMPTGTIAYNTLASANASDEGNIVWGNDCGGADCDSKAHRFPQAFTSRQREADTCHHGITGADATLHFDVGRSETLAAFARCQQSAPLA
jgi:hypothetical protein